MLSFCQFYNMLNGEPYTDVPPPVEYKLASYGMGDGGHELKPLSQEDMCRYAADDVVDHYAKLHGGKSPSRLGKPMTDNEFRKFFGQTW